MGEFLGKRVVPRHEGDWDKARSYEPLMIVLDPETGDGYISRYDVPAGTLLTNEHYWAKCSHFNAQMHRLETDVAADVEEMHSDLASTKSAMSNELKQTHEKMAEELSETENRVGEKVNAATSAMKDTQNSIINARGGKDSLPQLLQAYESILQEVTDCHTDSTGVEYDSLADRLKLIDAMAAPRLPVASYFGPRDNENGALKNGEMGAEVDGQNVIFKFDHTAYVTQYEKTYWTSVHFAYCISYEQMMKLKRLDRLYLELNFEGVGPEGNKGHEGEELRIQFYVNGTSNWASTINPITGTSVVIGSKIFFPLEQELVEKVLAKEKPLYILFAGNFLNNDVVKDLGQIQLTTSIVNQQSSSGRSQFISHADHAETASFANEAGSAVHAEDAVNAENADYAGSAGSAIIADNFFLVPADELLNYEKTRYSPGMDTLKYPEQYPYAYRFGFQSTGNRASAKIKGTGFDQVVEFSIGLSKESDQPHNQGYAKNLNGMMSFDDMLRKFEEGYRYCYLCTIEEYENYPEGVLGGAYDNRLLIAYYLDSKFTNPINVAPVLKRTIYGNRKMYVWRFAFTQEMLEVIQTQKEAGKFSTSWFGIWNTLKYSGEEPVVWTPKWYWQDYAFADDSFSNEDMATFFQSKYTYWGSYVNHGKLKERFAGLDASLEQLESDVEKAEETLNGQEERLKKLENPSGALTGIVCWGDSLTAGGGWTATLQKLSELPVYNGGTGGENARTIAARQGADVMMVNNITIPAACEPVTIAVRKTDSGILTEEGYKVTPLLQGGAHVNPVKIEDVSCYQYDSKGTNLNTHVTKAARVAHGSEIYAVFFGEILENAYRLDISPCVARKEAIVECDSRCVLLDVTGQSDKELQALLSRISSSPLEDSILQYYETWGVAGKVMSVPYADSTGISDQAREMLGNVAYGCPAFSELIPFGGKFQEKDSTYAWAKATVTRSEDWGVFGGLRLSGLAAGKYLVFGRVEAVESDDTQLGEVSIGIIEPGIANWAKRMPCGALNKSRLPFQMSLVYDYAGGKEYLNFAVQLTGSNYTSFVVTMWVLNVTGLSEEEIEAISHSSITERASAVKNATHTILAERTVQADNADMAKEADHAASSDTAKKAESADIAGYAALSGNWKGKKALVIGDSITAAGKWQKKLEELLGMNVATHAKGGIGILRMTDGDNGLDGTYNAETDKNGVLRPLMAADVEGVSLIVVLPAYNERATALGSVGDCHPEQETICGRIQYLLNRIYEELEDAGNLTCHVLVATPHCAGKYPYVDADGYEEYPSGTGQTMEKLSDTIKAVAQANNVAVCDLWHESGINRRTWSVFGAQKNAVNEQYAKYQLDASGKVVGSTPQRYVNGQSYYQKRNGSIVLEKYTGSSPYPFNGDQLHCSTDGYARIGECIVGAVIRAFGK